jgi:hypothetical protein
MNTCAKIIMNSFPEVPMKKLLMILLFPCLVSVAQADIIPARVYVIYLDYSYPPIEELWATEFQIDNLPLDQCTLTEHWNTELIIGNVEEGIALAFLQPLTGPLFYFGYLEFIAWEPVANDHVMTVVANGDTGMLAVVDGDYAVIIVGGGNHTFNCTEQCDWFCYGSGSNGVIGLWTEMEAEHCSQDIEVATTPNRDSSFSAVKALY